MDPRPVRRRPALCAAAPAAHQARRRRSDLRAGRGEALLGERRRRSRSAGGPGTPEGGSVGDSVVDQRGHDRRDGGHRGSRVSVRHSTADSRRRPRTTPACHFIQPLRGRLGHQSAVPYMPARWPPVLLRGPLTDTAGDAPCPRHRQNRGAASRESAYKSGSLARRDCRSRAMTCGERRRSARVPRPTVRGA